MEIGKESVSNFLHGHKTVGVARTQLSAAKYEVHKGILLRVPGAGDAVANTYPVWVGGRNVTADSNESTGGIPLTPGESMFIPLDDITSLYVISTGADQDLAWMVV